jgi:hypothetical protein
VSSQSVHAAVAQVRAAVPVDVFTSSTMPSIERDHLSSRTQPGEVSFEFVQTRANELSAEESSVGAKS